MFVDLGRSVVGVGGMEGRDVGVMIVDETKMFSVVGKSDCEM